MFICIAKTEPDWHALLKNAQESIGRSITASLDERNLPLAGIASFLVALSEFEGRGDAVAAMRDNRIVRKHASFAFLVNVPRVEFFTLVNLGLAVTAASDGDFAVVSGKLSEWVEAVVGGTRLPQLRKFFCLMLAYFERENLGECWSAWEKDHRDDGLYQLVRKS